MDARPEGTFLSDDEITRVVDFVGGRDPQIPPASIMRLRQTNELEAAATGGVALPNRDDLYDAPVDIVVRERR